MRGDNFEPIIREDLEKIKAVCNGNKVWPQVITDKQIETVHYSISLNSKENLHEINACKHAHDKAANIINAMAVSSIYDTREVVVDMDIKQVYSTEDGRNYVYLYVNIPKEHRGFIFGKKCINLNILRTMISRLYRMYKSDAYIEFEDK